MRTKGEQQKVQVITLGCSKNLVDSENIITQLQGNQINAFHEQEDEDPDVVIVNTCGFIETAKEESINTILENVQRKLDGEIEKLFVTGCLSHRYKEDLEKEIPEVDAYFGTLELPGLLAKFNADYKHELIGERRTTTLSHYAYLKISEGCNRTCSFCAIPLMRGGHISRPIEELVHEAKQLAKRGIKEIILIAQELTYYGLDLYKKRELNRLLQALNDVEGIEWIRLHYAYPSKFPIEVFDAIAELPKVCKYLDIPLQHANDDVMNRMKRQTTRAYMTELLNTARTRIPDLAIRTTFLIGFPGETEEEFEDLMDFVREQRFERVGVFAYSHEDGTSAYDLEDDIPDDIKRERMSRLMELQKDISMEKNVARIGSKLKVLIDRKEGEYYIGRTEFDSPEVDNEVLIKATDQYLREGDFVMTEIIDAEEFDLYARVLL